MTRRKNKYTLIRNYVRASLKEGGMSSAALASGEFDREPPKPDSKFITNIALTWMKWAHQKELVKTFERYKPFVERAGAGNNDTKERLAAFEKLQKEIKNPITFFLNVKNASQYWVGLAALVPKEQSGQVMGERLSFRQDIVNDCIENVESWIKEAVSQAWKKFKEDPRGSVEAVYEIWKNLPDREDEATSTTNAPTKAAVVGSLVQFVLMAVGKKITNLTTPAAVLSTLYTLKQYMNYKSDLVSLADEMIGDSSITLQNQFLPPSFKKMDFLKTAKTAAAGLLGDPEADAAGYARMMKAMGRD